MMAQLQKRRVGRTLTLLGMHAIVLYDCYILALPMIMVMWEHWQHVLIYIASVAFVFPSLFHWRRPLFRDVLYLAGVAGLYFHWYLISSATDIAYKTAPFAKSGIYGSLPFQITVALQVILMPIGYVKRFEA